MRADVSVEEKPNLSDVFFATCVAQQLEATEHGWADKQPILMLKYMGRK